MKQAPLMEDLVFVESKRIVYWLGFIGICTTLLGIYALTKMAGNTWFAVFLLVCGLWTLTSAALNATSPKGPIFILKKDGIWFVNSEGLLPYDIIGDMQVERYSSLMQPQRNMSFTIAPEDKDRVPEFRGMSGLGLRLSLLLWRTGAHKGRAFKRTMVVFRYSGLKLDNGESVDAEMIEEEIARRINVVEPQVVAAPGY
ncbi:hypothetical protein [Bordetella sp. LUAb4]|uniref:hypothetical protein n=1 Tax=Bordetella sp. LUAb4 TaxID=2843195 RepID=UPI001E602FAA|nr:hypothetical protein [Bordetella sp. LUAb4]